MSLTMAEQTKPQQAQKPNLEERVNALESGMTEMLTMMREDRTSRTAEQRAGNPVHESYNQEWDESQLLANPGFAPRPGMVQRWIRTEIAGEQDGSNIARMFNMGWVIRDPSTLPESVAKSCKIVVQGDAGIGWRGTVLCEMPEAQYARIKARHEQASSAQMSAIEQNMFREHDGSQRGFGAPHFTQRQRTVETGRPAPVDG